MLMQEKIMWSVVHFIDDNTVEAVPSFWFENHFCAWPKKNASIFIKRKTIPNKFEFDYLSARKLYKDLGNTFELDQYNSF